MIGRTAEDFFPEFRAGIRDEKSADASTHAVADNDHRLADGIFFSDGIELAAQDRSGVGKGVAARVAVEPELVILADRLVAAEVVDERSPSRGSIHETVNDEDDGLVRIVGLEAGNSSGLRVFFGMEQAGEFKFFRLGFLEHHGERHGEIGGEWLPTAFERNRLGGERVFEGKFGDRASEADHRSDAVVNMGKRKSLGSASVFIAADGDDGRTDTGLDRALVDILAVDIELVGGHEFVEGGIPARAGVFFSGEDEFAIRGGNPERSFPWCELGLLERINNAGDGEIVGVASGGVGGICCQLARGRAGFQQKAGEASGRLALAFLESCLEALGESTPVGR